MMGIINSRVYSRYSISLKFILIEILKGNMQGRNPEKKISSKYPLSPIRQERKSSYSTKKLSDKLTDSIKRRSQLLKSNLKKKNFLINDNDYNSMIYDWRKTANASIVKVFALSEKKELDEKSGNLYIKKVVKV